MKKLFVFLFAFAAVAALAGCGQKIDISEEDIAAVETAVNEALEEEAGGEESTATNEAATIMEGFALYSNADYAFSIQYPSAWEMQENAYGSHVMFFTPQGEEDMFRENIGVITEELPMEMDVDSYYNEAKVHLVDYISDFEEITNKNIKLGDFDAKKVQYLGTQGDYTLKRQQVFFIKDQTTYVITYTAMADTFDEFIGTVDEMVETMTVE